MTAKKPVLADHFKNYIYPCALTNAGGRNVAFGIYSVDMEQNSYPYKAHLLEQDQVTDLPELFNSVSWSEWKDENTCIVCESGDEGCTVSEFSRVTGEKTPVFTVNKTVSHAIALSGNRWLVLCYENLRTLDYTKEQLKEAETYDVYEEYPFRYNGMGSCDRIRTRLYLWENGALTLLTGAYEDVGEGAMAGNEFIFTGNEFTEIRNLRPILKALDTTTMQIREVPVDTGYYYIYTVACDEHHVICARSDSAKYGDFQNDYLDLLDVRDGTYKRINDSCDIYTSSCVLTEMSYGCGGMNLVPYKTGVLFMCTDGDYGMIKYADFETGEVRNIVGEDFVVGEFALTKDQKTIYFIAQKGMGGAELWSVPVEGGEICQLTHYNDEVSEAYEVSKIEKFTFTGAYGDTVDGYIMRPPHFEEGRKYKTVLNIHGGPNISYGVCYNHQLQYFAAQGYVVVYGNIHGSSGRGAEFADMNKKYFTIDVDDLHTMIDTVIERYPFVDADAIACTGGSYGGMLVDWLITHTDRFKTAISDRGCALEMEDLFMSDCGLGFCIEQRGGNMWDPGVAELVWDQSPIKYAPQAKTPTLFIHGENDYRCTKEQSLTMFVALRLNGVKTKVYIFKNEGHGLCYTGAPKNRMKRLEVMRDWLAETL